MSAGDANMYREGERPTSLGVNVFEGDFCSFVGSRPPREAGLSGKSLALAL